MYLALLQTARLNGKCNSCLHGTIAVLVLDNSKSYDIDTHRNQTISR